jgi:TetR/AcrR family transcriptional regulator, transcriptional repressor for nem operon
MPAKKIEKHELLHRCWEVFHRHGYYGTSVSMLAEAIGMGKSGVMHHHTSKEGLLRAVIGYAKQQMRDYVLSVAREDLPDEQRLEKLLRRQNRLAKHEQRGCFFANLALETGREGLFNEELTHFFEEWQLVLSGIWATRLPQEAAVEHAYLLLLEYEGAVTIYKLSGDEQHLERLVRRAVQKFKQYSPLPAHEALTVADDETADHSNFLF